MKTVAQLLALKPSGIVGIAPGVTVLDAVKLLAEKNVGAVIAIDGPRLVGMFSERDYVRKVDLKGKSSATTPVSDVMTREVVFVTPAHTNEDCMALIRELHSPLKSNEREAARGGRYLACCCGT